MSKIISFSKYQGAGNDFILIDNRNGDFDRNNVDLVKRLCDRRFGIGGDGLMLLGYTKNNFKAFDFEMVYFNADGREGSMCGNGGRCIVAFARDLEIISSEADFLAVDGPHEATLHGDIVRLGMIEVDVVDRDREAYVMNTGSPHYVEFVENLKDLDVFEAGKAIRYNDTYIHEGINVNFIEAEGSGYFCRTYERGVENETYACGTGVTAAAIAVATRSNLDGDILVPIRVLGGQLKVSFIKNGTNFSNIFLEGPAKFVFKGQITV